VEPAPRADLVTIDGMRHFGKLEREPVQFPHDAHTEALASQNKDCSACHLTMEDGYLSQKFMRLEDTSREDVMNLYHGRCITCHEEQTAGNAQAKSGPVACGDCHRSEPLYRSTRLSFGMDKSLHYRHVEANENKCEACHHIYDEASKKLVYVKGRENSCRDCHRAEKADSVPSFPTVAHWACIGCHMKTGAAHPGEKIGPHVCAGCHDAKHQAAIAVIDNPPRLMRGQPDFALLSVAEAERKSSKLNTVPFSHIGHEQVTETCRVCHHEEMKSCMDCHTLHGSDEGDNVTLQQAMHNINSNHSCIGCHQLQKSAIECAGCHNLMEQGELSDHACPICHAGPPPDKLDQVAKNYTSLDAFRPKPEDVELNFTAEEIPETVRVDGISKRYAPTELPGYGPVTMPHRLIVKTLSKYIAGNKIAVYFHGRENVMCEGCHHHGSIGREPALCENCHGQPFDAKQLFKPGLYGAYHRQCLGCHVSMKLQKATNCTFCHKDKTAALQEATSRYDRVGSRQ